MIKIEKVTKRFKDIIALDNISLTINSGEFFGLLGPNGAGKSTLMNILAGYLDSDEGTVFFKDYPIRRNSMKFRKKIGLAPQSLALYEDISAEANLKIFGSLYNLDKDILKASLEEKLYMVGLYERRKDLVKTFSGGMKRRLNLAAALLHSPKVLLCDEPTVGVDPQSRNAIFDFLEKINSEGITVIYTTHYMEEAERLCRRIAVIDMGKIIADGTTPELLKMLPYKEEILLQKNERTSAAIDSFKILGEISEVEENFVIKIKEKFKMSDIFKTVENAGLDYSNVNIHKPTLEELFLKLTGRRLRD
jgi:ABC-2 type transport system ATP-binding protein